MDFSWQLLGQLLEQVLTVLDLILDLVPGLVLDPQPWSRLLEGVWELMGLKEVKAVKELKVRK